MIGEGLGRILAGSGQIATGTIDPCVGGQIVAMRYRVTNLVIG
jgi:hypothetical protein